MLPDDDRMIEICRGLIIRDRCLNDLVDCWLEVVQGTEDRILFRKQLMFDTDAFKGQLTLDVRSVICAETFELVVITE
jgi:hypothetical protein